MSGSNDEEFWLFGYGSLIWKPPPHFDLRIPGSITGYIRRFWQASEDHRGTPHSPGRVVTLIAPSFPLPIGSASPPPQTESPPRVHGVAYRIPPQHVHAVKSYLDMREINGYSIQHTTFYPSPSPQSSSPSPQPSHKSSSSPQPIPHCTIYIGLPNNPQFHPQPPQEIARVIARSHGPSGANAEYLFMLEAGLRELSGEEGGCVDEHVRDLSARVRVLMARDGEGDGKERDGDDGEVGVQAVETEVQRVRRGDGGQASEETEKGITGLEID